MCSLNIERVFFYRKCQGKEEKQAACNWIKSLKEAQLTTQSSKRDKHFARNPHSMLLWQTIQRQFKNRHCFFYPSLHSFLCSPQNQEPANQIGNMFKVQTKISLQPTSTIEESLSLYQNARKNPQEIKRSNSRTCQRTKPQLPKTPA